MKTRNWRYMVGDFETTVYPGQSRTDVWASALVDFYSEDVKILHSIGETFDYLVSLNQDCVIYYHNLKFDGAFWLDFLINDLKYKQAVIQDNPDDINSTHFIKKSKLGSKTFSYSISNRGQWYVMDIKVGKRLIELRDSLKLLPFSVERIGQSFKTKHKKLNMEYEGVRWPGCEITDEEKHYISNDVLVVKEALETMKTEGHTRLTIGSCCLAEFKQTIGRKLYDEYFPNVAEMSLDAELYGYNNVDSYVRQAYRGGWCYLVPEKANKILHDGLTIDVNSLYPSVMHSESLSKYPVGEPTFWKGNYIPEEAKGFDKYYFVRLKTRFYIKEGELPFIQVKNTLLYRSTEMLKSSDILNPEDGEYYPEYYDANGNLVPAIITMTLTMTDYQLMLDHYDLVDCEILDGCYFNAVIGIFDEYINKYKEIKMNSTGAIRELAKLFLNNLYGKLAASTNSSFKVAYKKEDTSIGFYNVTANDKIPGYIPAGAAITSYARNFTIRVAQQNYHGPNEPGFVYADTDSCHCDLRRDELVGAKIHPTDFCCWKIEHEWDFAYFVRQKTYIERVIKDDGKEVDPYYLIKCAGMPDYCKNLFLLSLGEKVYKKDINGEKIEFIPEEEEDLEFINERRTIEDFKVGLRVPGKLTPKRIPGGVLLVRGTYQMRPMY